MTIKLTIQERRYPGGFLEHKIVDPVGWVHAAVYGEGLKRLNEVHQVLSGSMPTRAAAPHGWTIKETDAGEILVGGPLGGITICPILAAARGSLSRRILVGLAQAILQESAGERITSATMVPTFMPEPAPDLEGDLHAAGYRDGWNACVSTILATMVAHDRAAKRQHQPDTEAILPAIPINQRDEE